MDATTSATLDRYYVDVPEQLRRFGSVQSSFEREMDRRSTRAKHPLTPWNTGAVDGDGKPVIRYYGGLRCGPIYCGQGAENRVPDCHPDDRDPGLSASEFARRVERALAGISAEDRHVLRLRFREPLSAAWVPYGIARPRPGAIGQALPRGSGNVAHLTAAAIAAHGRARTTLDVRGWLDRLGSKAERKKLTADERALVAQIGRECETIVAGAIARFHAAFPRLPSVVHRRAVAAQAAA